MDMTEHKEIPLRIIPFLSNYALAVLWFTAEFHNNNLLIRNVNPYVIELLSKYVDVVPENSKTFQDKESSLYVIHHDELVYFLKTVKFFNVGDKRRVAPPVEPFIFVKAFTETRCVFNWRRCYNKGSQSNPIHDSFTPYVSYKDNYDVVEAYKNALVTSPAAFSVREGPDGVALVTPNIDMFVGGYNVRDFAVAIQIHYKPGLTLKIWNRSVAGMRVIDKQFYDVER